MDVFLFFVFVMLILGIRKALSKKGMLSQRNTTRNVAEEEDVYNENTSNTSLSLIARFNSTNINHDD